MPDAHQQNQDAHEQEQAQRRLVHCAQYAGGYGDAHHEARAHADGGEHRGERTIAPTTEQCC